MSGIKVPIGIDLDTGTTDQQIDQLNKRIKDLAKSVTAIQNVEFTPISANSKKELDAIIEQSNAVLKKQDDLARRLQRNGMGHFRTPLQANWDELYPNPVERSKMLRSFLQGIGAEFNRPEWKKPDYASGSGVRPPAPPTPPPPGSLTQARGEAPGGGGGGGGMGIGGMGIASFIGNLGVQALAKIASEVMAKISDSQNLAIITDRVMRQAGRLTNFDSSRYMLYSGANNLGMKVNEFAQYASNYQRQSGYKGDSYDLARTAMTVGQFGRGYGLEPDEAMGVFAGAQRVGVANNDQQIRKLGLLIGEGVGRSHAFSSMDKFTAVVGSYITSSARETMTMPNTPAYIASLAGLINSGPGADVEGSAAMLSQIDAAIKRGGNAGEAGVNFNARVAMRNHMNPIEMMMLQAGGAWATKSSTMGAGTDYAQATGDVQSGDKTALQMMMESFNGEFSSPSMRIMALQKYMGVNPLLAAKMVNMRPAEIGQTAQSLTRYGIDTSKLDLSTVPDLVRVNTQGREGATSVATQLLRGGKLSPGERDQLSKAMAKGSDEELKKITSQLVAAHGQTETEGSQTRKSIAELSNVIEKQSDKLLQPLNVMRMALVKMAGGSEKDIEDEYWAGREKDAEKEGLAQIDAQIAAAQNANTDAYVGTSPFTNQTDAQKATNEKVESLSRQRQNARNAIDAKVAVERMRASTSPSMLTEIGKRKVSDDTWTRIDKYRPIINEAASIYHVDPQLLTAIAIQESHGNPNLGVNGKGARGMFQVTEGANITGQNLSTVRGNIMAGAAYLADRQKKYGKTAGIPAYNAGSPGNFQNDETRGYLPSVENYWQQVKQHDAGLKTDEIKLHPDSIAAIGDSVASKVHSQPMKTEIQGRPVVTTNSSQNGYKLRHSWN